MNLGDIIDKNYFRS